MAVFHSSWSWADQPITLLPRLTGKSCLPEFVLSLDMSEVLAAKDASDESDRRSLRSPLHSLPDRDTTLEKIVWRKIDLWILPIATMFYLLSFLVSYRSPYLHPLPSPSSEVCSFMHWTSVALGFTAPHRLGTHNYMCCSWASRSFEQSRIHRCYFYRHTLPFLSFLFFG